MPLSPSNYYRSLCCHVQTFVIAYCVAEIVIISLTFATRLEHPLMVCRSVNMTSVGEFSLGRGGARLKVHEARICYTCSPLLFLILLHLAFDFLALIAIKTERYRLLLPYLFLIGFNLLLSVIFFITVIVAFAFIGVTYEMRLIIFVAVQFSLKIHELICGRRLYWYLIWRDGNRSAPESSIIKDTDQFQF